MAVITISRQHGCGGEYVAERVAKKLGYRLVSKELIEYAAVLSGMPKDRAISYDEEHHSSLKAFLSRFIDLDMFTELLSIYKTDKEFAMTLPAEPASIFDRNEYKGIPADSEHLQKTMERIILKLALEDNVVIVGRGGQALLAHTPHAVHFRYVADLNERVKWHQNREGISEDAAREQVLEIDRRKASFLRDYYKVEVNDPSSYHAVINISRYSLEEAVELSLEAARIRLGVKAV